MSKKRVGINLDEDILKRGKDSAYENRESFSGYLEKLIMDMPGMPIRVGMGVPGSKLTEQLDRIEAMLNRLVPEKRGTPIYGDGINSVTVPEGSLQKFDRSKMEDAKSESQRIRDRVKLDGHPGFCDPKVFEPVTEDEELKAANERLLKNRLEIAKLKAKGLQTGNEVPFRSMPKGGK